MKFIKSILGLLLILIALTTVSATQEQVRVVMDEYVDQEVYYNPLKTGGGIWYDTTENQSSYNITGYITVTNQNPNGKTVSDVYILFNNTRNITLPTYVEGRTGKFVVNDTTAGSILLHIPELRTGENSTWIYDVNTTSVRPPLNFTTNYSAYKVLAGNNITMTDTIENVFANASYQSNTCIYGINITQVTVPVDFNGNPQDYYFMSTSTAGSDAGNVAYSADNKTLYWDALNGGCLNLGSSTDISYIINTPLNIPQTTHYTVLNSTLRYTMNSTMSHLRVTDIRAISEANISFEKRIMSPSHPVLYGSNVTWNVTGYFSTGTNISYELREVTFWVSQRNVNGSYTDPNTIDNDTINNASLYTSSNPYVLINQTSPWMSNTWLFNYTDIPSPIVWMDINYSMTNDGVQLINRSYTQNGNDLYIKELYLIIGYWLEIEKNITSINNNTYAVKIDVHNKGNQVTPGATVVTIYDFIPSNYMLNGTFSYSSSPWYNTTQANNSVNGQYNGTLHQWALLPNNALNTSFAAGPGKNENTTWSVQYNVTGYGDYELMDVFITGLDPQQVDGAGSTKAVVVSEIIDRVKSTEGIFAIVASVLLLLGLLL